MVSWSSSCNDFPFSTNRTSSYQLLVFAVAVTGLPDPRHDHAIVMARFAKDIMEMMTDLCQRLEVILGPDTGKPSSVKKYFIYYMLSHVSKSLMYLYR